MTTENELTKFRWRTSTGILGVYGGPVDIEVVEVPRGGVITHIQEYVVSIGHDLGHIGDRFPDVGEGSAGRGAGQGLFPSF